MRFLSCWLDLFATAIALLVGWVTGWWVMALLIGWVGATAALTLARCVLYDAEQQARHAELLAWLWERRAIRAEEELRQSQEQVKS